MKSHIVSPRYEGGINGKIGVTDAVRPMTLSGFSFTLKSFSATFDNGDLTACEATGDIGLRDPMAGTLSTKVTITDAPSFAGEVKTEHPVAIPSWSVSFSLMEGCSFTYDEKAEVTLNFAAKSDYFEQMEVQGLKVNSDYEMSLEGFSYSGRPQKFMKAFQYQITTLAISFDAGMIHVAVRSTPSSAAVCASRGSSARLVSYAACSQYQIF